EDIEYEKAICEDLKLLNISYDKLVFSSMHFQTMIEKCSYLIKKGYAYADNSSEEEVKNQRENRIASKNRDN
ncbi:MAG: hypothetical protein MHPSP_004379, partial [Paramarteilia canceri]